MCQVAILGEKRPSSLFFFLERQDAKKVWIFIVLNVESVVFVVLQTSLRMAYL